MELLQRELNSVFMTVGDADTLVHPNFFDPVLFESQVASLVNLYFGSHHAYSLYVRPLNLACYRLGQSGDSDVDAYHKFFKFISQARVAPPWFWRSEPQFVHSVTRQMFHPRCQRVKGDDPRTDH